MALVQAGAAGGRGFPGSTTSLSLRWGWPLLPFHHRLTHAGLCAYSCAGPAGSTAYACCAPLLMAAAAGCASRRPHGPEVPDAPWLVLGRMPTSAAAL